MAASGNVKGIPQARTAFSTTEAAQWGGIQAIGEEIVNNLAPASTRSLQHGLSSMQEVGMPDQNFTATRQKLSLLDLGLPHGVLPVLLEKTLRMGLSRNFPWVEP